MIREKKSLIELVFERAGLVVAFFCYMLCGKVIPLDMGMTCATKLSISLFTLHETLYQVYKTRQNILSSTTMDFHLTLINIIAKHIDRERERKKERENLIHRNNTIGQSMLYSSSLSNWISRKESF